VEERRAWSQIEARYGQRQGHALSGDERRQIIEEQAAASATILGRFGISPKDYARATARLTREELQAAATAETALLAREQAQATQPSTADEPQIGNPKTVVLDPDRASWPEVEEGLPVD
jgi:hypothetical protein